MKRVILLGASGYVGQSFWRELSARRYEFICPERNEYNSFKGMSSILKIASCDLVINCAAFVTKPSVDLCENFKCETLAGNLVLPINISNACEVNQIPFIQVSTGCLYNGNNGGEGYKESDKPHIAFNSGAGFYVGSKQLMEDSIKYDKTYLCRIRLPFDQHDNHRNYLSKILRYKKVYSNGNSISHRGDFANACLDLFEFNAPFGTYNMTNEGSITAREIADMMHKTICKSRVFKFWEEEEFMRVAAKTLKSNCVLNISKLLSTGVKMRHVSEAIQDSLDNWVWEE